jgi:hypothetical protein
MRKALVALYILVLLTSCKKTIVEEVEGDSFRISILPVLMEGFDHYKFTGTLDLRHAADHVEYGLLLGKSINPTVENAVKLPIGQAGGSVDFTKEVSGLDTGIVYYVRAYGLGKSTVQYSANQIIGKVSPNVYSVEGELNYGRPITIVCNLPKLSSNSTVKVFLNETPVTISAINSGNDGSIMTAEVPDQLSPGKYRLSLAVNNLKIVSRDSLRLFEGRWDQVHDLPGDLGWPTQVADFFLSNDLIYISTLAPSSTGNFEKFQKYNYKTQEIMDLKHFDNSSSLDRTSALQQGNLIHFICGNSDIYPTKRHYVYNTASDSWTHEADFPGGERQSAVSILANNKIYFGMGYSPAMLAVRNVNVFTDMWSYDLNTKVWKKQSPFPEVKGRILNASFTIGTKLYLTGGSEAKTGDASPTSSRETWCYDTTADQWTRKADYPGQGALDYCAFSIGEYGYVGMGESSTYDSYDGRNGANDMFKYDPVKDKWTEVSHLQNPVFSPFCGTNNNTAVVGGGSTINSFPAYKLFVYTSQK